jgi:16S rRNA (cytidine1402-2'-O)-methyltransferase
MGWPRRLPRRAGDEARLEQAIVCAGADCYTVSLRAAGGLNPCERCKAVVTGESANLPAGRLFLVGTPIGNLEDITLRALNTLRVVDLIACEDTRHSQKLLNHFGIKTPRISYHEHNELTRAPELILKLEEGASIALVTDAGMPGVSDPGYRLVHLAVRHRIPVIPVPGVTALITALAASGLPTDQFLFAGFLPPRKTARLKSLTELARCEKTLVFYEAPQRVLEMLKDCLEILGDRPAALARELTKVHEEFRRGPLTDLLRTVQRNPAKGEITVVVGPGKAPARAVAGSMLGEVQALMAERGLDERAALKTVARSRGISRSEAYRQLLREKATRL